MAEEKRLNPYQVHVLTGILRELLSGELPCPKTLESYGKKIISISKLTNEFTTVAS